MGNWISVAQNLPEAGKKVLATFKNSHGKHRTICAHYAPQFAFDADGAGEDCPSEYSEENDHYYVQEGWYENIENWGEYSSVYVCEGDVTHWMPLPPPPPERLTFATGEYIDLLSGGSNNG